MVKSYKDLIVWQKGIELVKLVYRITAQFPKEELYGLVSQMRRAAVSIPSNISEGQQRRGTKEFTQFLRVAAGSVAELETQTIIARDLYPHVDCIDIFETLTEIQKMLFSLMKKLETSPTNH